MNTFKLDGTDFGVGEVVCKIENDTLTLKITADEEITEKIADDENGKWSWLGYDPPSVVFRGVPFTKGCVEIDEDLLDEYDIWLYIMEHYNIFGVLSVDDDCVKVSGEVRYPMSDKKLYSLEIVAKRQR
jgi:hypothetical protein